MEKRRVMRRNNLRKKLLQNEEKTRTVMNQSKELLKHPVAKGLAIAAALYCTLYGSKYIIKQYAEVVVAAKKLRDTHRL